MKNVFNTGLNLFIFRCKFQLLQEVWTNKHPQKVYMVILELFRISTSFATVPPPPPKRGNSSVMCRSYSQHLL